MARDFQGNKEMKDNPLSQRLLMYMIAAAFAFVWFTALFGFHFMGWMGAQGAAAGLGWKLLSVLGIAIALGILVTSDRSKSGASAMSYFGAVVFYALAVWAALGFAS